MMKWALTAGLLGMSGMVFPAHAGEATPRYKYLNQMCHHSTAAIFKHNLKREAKDVNVYCECVSNNAVLNLERPQDHAYALAYHEANIVIERSKRYNQPMTEIAEEFELRAMNYKADYEISLTDLTTHFSQAFEDVKQCYDATPRAASFGLRGSFSSASN